MNDQITRINDAEEDESHVSTPIASQQRTSTSDDIDRLDNDTETLHSYSTTTAPVSEGDIPYSEEDRGDEVLDEEPRTVVLPVPTSSAGNQPTDALAEGYPPTMTVSLDSLPLEAATAPITVGAESRFVETSSATTARELKRLYDQHIGAGKDASIRSPFVITAFTSQHGKQMYRVGRRDMDKAPHGNADDLDIGVPRVQSTSVENSRPSRAHSSATNGTNARRRSRVSVASFFKNGHAHHGSKPVPPQDGTRSPPTRKLRRTRSIPNMVTAPAVDATASPATPTHTTGRPHAHSVSSVDAFRPTSLPPPLVEPIVKSPRPDYLASVLSWNTVPSSPLSSGSGLRSVQSLHSGSDVNGDDHLADTIRYPFGRGIAFDSPVRPSPSHLNSPPVLREMQSFESGLTARADPSSRTIRLSSLRTRPSNESVNVSDNGSNRGEEPSREESTIHLMPSAEHLQNTAMYTRYSTELFEVIQNYKGIPIFDKVADIPDPPTIKLSLKADGDPAVPRDDPRFVIWGEVEGDELDDNSASRSNTDIASVHSSLSRQRSTRDRASSAMAERPSIRTPSTERPKRVLVAATIERWIAQLTSELNYDELLIFFLTYRSYISALDLGHLLICRFHWALAEPRSPQDDHVRRIVRARTFIAIRYWLLTFFSCDFVPNRDLRLLFGNWLNNLHKDPILQRHKDAPGIVRKLRKVAKDCKDGYTRGQHKKSTTEKSDILPSTSIDFSQGDFAKNLRKAVGKGDEDDDIDLDFIGVPATGVQFGPNLNASSSGNAAIDLAMMAQPLHLTYLQMGKQTAIATTADVLPAQLPLPVPHNAISRVVVNAIGRLGRWKRVLNYRALNTRGAPVRPSLGGTCLDTSNFDLEASETGDLLLEAGGVEKYLKMLENQRKPGLNSALIPSLPAPSPLGLGPTNVPGSSISTATSTTAHTSLEPLTETSDEGGSTDEGPRQSSDPPSSRTSVASESVRFRHSISGSESTAIAPMDVVSIDDLDLSDLSSEDLHAPPPQSGLRKMGRRLPNRRDFELVRRSVDSVSSMGIHSAHARDSVLSTGSSAASSGPDMPGPIQDWQMNALVDSLSDDDEPGDVEAALKRLEGQINRDKQKHKQTKVDEWVKSINRTRHVRGGLNAGLRRYYSSDEEDYGEVQNSLRDNGAGQPSDSYASSRSSVSSVVSPTSAATHEEVSTPASPPGLNHTPNGSNDVTAAQDQDTETLSPRPSRPTSSFVTSDRPVSLGMPSLAPSMGSGAFVRPEKSLKKHRSFVLAYKSEAIVQHFSVIDRDLFVHLKFEELVSPEWMASTEEYNVLDWSAYVKERHIMKTEQQIVVPPLTVIRNRFNITVNFVISEIILTHPSERVMVYSKFVRIAWKAYTLKNYHLLVATIAGLDSSWVQRALKQTRAKKRPIWESRVHHDLRQWCTSQDDFKHIRAAVEALVEAKSRAVGSPEPSQQDTSEPQSATSRARAASEGKPPAPPSCVPFFGIYLSELHRFNSLPDLIDPTAPQEPVDMDPATGAFELAHPEVFSYLAPLPSTMQLEPLINVHKQRLVAGVVKSFVNGQHLAIKVDHMVEKKLYQKCMHLRGLEPETLQRVLALYSKWES